jgi:hypothetical protein
MAAKPLTMTQFKVDLGHLQDATGVVKTQAGVIRDNCVRIGDLLNLAPASFKSPAGQTFEELIPPCIKQMQALDDLLTQMEKRMQAAHETYLHIEQTNTRNLQ